MEVCYNTAAVPDAVQERESLPNLDVDPFLKEALQNPRHRLAVLRMELDIQRFMQNPEQHQFEFQHFPTSYLRLAAHRVAQHYGLQSMVVVVDGNPDGSGSKIVVRKTPQSRFPIVCLYDIPAKLPENDKSEHIKIAIRPRRNKASWNDPADVGTKRSPVRTVEERKEEYDRARARIFSSSSSNGDVEVMSSSGDENENYRNSIEEPEKITTKDSNCRVAIFRDREKDRSDPDYDRSYDRYVRGQTPYQNCNLGPFNLQTFQLPPFIQCETGFPQLGQLPRVQNPLNFRPSSPALNPFSSLRSNQASRDAVYLHWPSPAMMYSHSYEHFRQAVIQTPFYQQPLSFDHGQHY